MAIPLFIALYGVVIAVVWRLWKSAERWYLAAYAVLVMLLCVSIWATDTHSASPLTPYWLTSFLAPAIAIVVAACLVKMLRPQAQQGDWLRVILFLLLIAPILVLLGYQVMLASIWDVATDGLSGLFLLQVVILTGIGAAIERAWSLPGRWKLVPLPFAAVIVISMGYAHRLGDYGPDGEWGKLPSIMTERRAEAIHRALLRYHEHNGIYPDALAELTPRYMLYLPTPFMIPGQAWCYEGGGEHFQFGYVYREFFSSPASARTYAAAGEPVDTVWKCP